MNITFSLAQIHSIYGDEGSNFLKASEMVAEAARRHSQIILLPELWSTGGVSEELIHLAVPLNQGIFARISMLARENHICILGSNLCSLEQGKYGNTAVFFDADGSIRASYTKIHLFSLMNEDHYLTSGEHLTLVEEKWGKAGLSICYDLRFPELYRTYAFAGAQMVFVSAAWPHPRLHHWQTLLRARAIENQMYIIACNQSGMVKDTCFFGHSCIIDPWGETLIEAGETEVLLTATIEMDVVNKIRNKMPVLADRKPEANVIK
jgi:predicted amidohydrolase